MQPTRLGMLASLSALGAALAFSCGTDEGTSPNVHPEGGADNGAPVAGQNMGATANVGGEPGGGTGGSSGASTSGGTAGDTAALGGAAGSLGSAGAGGEAVGPSSGEQLKLCDRLLNVVPHSTAVTRAFRNVAYVDCRITWVIPRATQLDDFVQALLIWNLQLWGCQGAPVTAFALAKPGAMLSAGDAAILIEMYMNAAQAELDLSPPEAAELRAAIERLAAPVVVSDSSEPSQSRCPVDMGNGGAGGAGMGAAGAAAGGATDAGGAAPSAAGQGGAP